jgi:hypothetical protein
MVNYGWIKPEIMPHFDPLGNKPHTIPAKGIFDAPSVNICINSEWAGHVSGMIERLTYEDAWLGTDDEIFAAIQQILKLLGEMGRIDNLGDCEMGCCNEKSNLTRINADGIIQTSNDGGITWTDNPAADPRNWTTILQPLPGSDDDTKKCIAANKVIGLLKEAKAQQDLSYDAGETIAEMIAALIAFLIAIGTLGTGAAFTPFLIALAGALIGIDKATFDASFSDSFWAKVFCILYCNIEPDASFTLAEWSNVMTQTGAISGHDIARAFVLGHFNAMGYIGLTNAARSSFSGALDCSGCCLDCPDAFIEIGTGSNIGCVYTVDSVNIGGSNPNVVYLRFSDPGSPDNSLCGTVGWEMVSGGVGVTDFYHCNTGSEYFTGSQGDCVCFAGWRDNSPFTIKITVGNC